MSKAKTMAQVSAKGVFNIFWGLVVSSIISAVSVMVVAGILSEGDYGLVTIALTGPALIGVLRDWGVDWATIKYTAQYRSENKEANVKNVIASVVFDVPAMAVDTHVFRVAARLGLTTNAKTPLAAEKQLVKNIPEEKINRAHHWLILHGRYICQARNPKCESCQLKHFCKYFLKNNSL